MDRRRFFTAAGTTAALAGFASDRAFADDHAKPGKRFDDATVKAMRDRIRPVGADEYQARQEQARRLMKENKIDAIFVEGGTSLVYFTGLHWWLSERLFAMVMPQSGDPFFISPKFEEGRAREKLGNTVKFYTWEEHEKPIDRIRQGLQDRKLLNATFGIEETVRYYAVEQLQQQLPTLKLVSAKPVTAGCRSVKSPHEVELMQIANDITAKVYLQLQRELREGIGERELGAILSALYGEFGVEGDALVLFGEASAYPHGLTRDVKLKSGDNVLVDGGCRVEGYGSDITRTMVLGEPSTKMKQVFDIVRGAQDAALKTAKPGVPAEKVDAAARNYITEHGFGPGYKYFTHRVGHGIGMDGHEWYYLVGGNTRPLVAGNMFSNEPGIYIVGEFGIRTEDEMLITDDGARLLLPPAASLQKIFV